MTDRADANIDQAIAWHLRLVEADEAEWAAFVAWLEADPDHAAAYDRVARDDRLLADAAFPPPASPPVAANDNRRWRGWAIGGGMGVALVAALSLLPSLPSPLSPDPAPFVVATRPGEIRTVALADGTRIEMSGGTTLRLDPAAPRLAALESGEAVFHVRHDRTQPFTVTTGSIALRDLGTVFDVMRERDRVTVAVAEGAVMFRPEREALTLRAGDRLVADAGVGYIKRDTMAIGEVGGWRRGSIEANGQPLGLIAERLTRLYAYRLSLTPDLSARPFTGMIHMTGTADRDVPHLAALIGADWRRDGDRWLLSSSRAAAR
ncbi:hypothetical protein GCM10011380_05890 [Sphingomonas metalli]|uniref:DUF4880 domain-containing protein n=1 Tax=Sphingomonas metalli TaxID=1779358 RepID=A0A916SY08_9SPHN|nr:FecR domain-containing protein [Sphingomonas metalli]GGB19141.1 hypothetical protein GCM10011380_05890 [Sphingomonas metalli]